jgi:dolichol-phosphate mannosyltransferase
MTARSSIYIVVPVLNERANIGRLVGSFRELVDEFGTDHHVRILMVDDGSTDGTAAEARRLADGLTFDVLTHPANLGPGAAFGTAFEHLAGWLGPADVVVTIEGDNTSRLELIRQMLVRAREGFDVVLASPYLYGGGIANTSPSRIFLSSVANVFVKEALGLRGIATVSSFFRLYRADVLRRLQACYGRRVLERRGFESMVEMTLKLVYLNATVSEVAMWLDTSLRVGKSKMHVVRTGLAYFTLWRDKGRWSRDARRRISP